MPPPCRWVRVTEPTLVKSFGFCHFAWINPSEFLGDHIFPIQGRPQEGVWGIPTTGDKPPQVIWQGLNPWQLNDLAGVIQKMNNDSRN